MSDPNEADLWHVEVEPGKDQVVTLEQLDDMFRLDLIHANTRVWQPGMSEPMPLSVVAGIDEEEDGGDSIEEIEEIEELEPSLPAFATAATVSAHPPAFGSVPPPSARSAPPPAASASPWSDPPGSGVPASLPPSAPTFSSAPPPRSARPSDWALDAQSLNLPGAPGVPESLRPMAMGNTDMPGGESSRLGSVVMALAVAAGLLITLYRNDLLKDLAVSAGQTSTYEAVEATVGSPGFGTTRSVEKLAQALTPVVAPVVTSSTRRPPPKATDDETPAVSVDSLKAEETKKQQAKKAAPRHQAPSKAVRKAPKKSGIKGSKLEFDPMNGTL
jgi:hypothetical protein